MLIFKIWCRSKLRARNIHVDNDRVQKHYFYTITGQHYKRLPMHVHIFSVLCIFSTDDKLKNAKRNETLVGRVKWVTGLIKIIKMYY